MTSGHDPASLDSERSVERRIVTVLFADLVGFTPLSERLDPEDVATIQDAYFASVRETIARYGGQIEKFIGDAAMAVFGVPRARDDDPERAVRAGFALINGVEIVGARLGLAPGELRLRVGINTGEVVYAAAGPDQGRVTGDTVNTAARIQAAAAANSIFVGESTALAVEDAIELERLPSLDLKGKSEPARLARAVAIRVERSRELAMAGLRAPLVGREVELGRLVLALDDVAATGRPQRWNVVAPPGVGKTRLLDEFATHASARGAAVRRLRLRPEASVPFAHMAELLHDALGPAGDGVDTPAGNDPHAPLRARLEMAGMLKARASVVAAEVVDHMEPGRASASTPGSIDRDARFRAWLDALDTLDGAGGQAGTSASSGGLAAAPPKAPRACVWIIEDAHWADDDFLAFLDAAHVDHLAGARLIVVTARPSLLERWQAAGVTDSAAGLFQLELGTLGRDTARALVTALVGNAVPDALAATIAERSDGNCLFIEELLRMWVSVGTLTRDGDSWLLPVPAANVPLPATVQAIYAAQLDDLPPSARQAARRGSVAGRRIPVAALESLGVSDGPAGVETLRRRNLVAGPQRDSVQGDTFAYRHALLRDAGYASLARAERALLHVRLARWLERAAGDHAAEVGAVIGGHYADALDSLPALASDVGDGLDRPACASLAAGWLERAGARAMRESAVATAASLFRRAVTVTPHDSPAELSRRLTLLGRALAPSGGALEAADAFQGAIAEARAARASDDPAWRTIFAGAVEALAMLHFERIRFADAWRLGDAALEEMGDLDDLDTARVRVARSRGRTGETNEAEGWVRDCERAIDAAMAVGDDDAEYEFRRYLTGARSEAGEATTDDWLDLRTRARARRDGLTEVNASINLAGYSMESRPADVPVLLEPIRELAVARGFVERLGWIDQVIAEAALGSGDWDSSIDAGLRAVDLGERHGYDRISVRSWSALLPAASLRGRAGVLEHAATWFGERAGKLPDSPYGRILHAAAALHIAGGDTRAAPVSDLEHVRPAFRIWLDTGGYAWAAATDVIVDAWFAAGRLDWIDELLAGASAAPHSPDSPSPIAAAGFELVRARRDLGAGANAMRAAERVRPQLAILEQVGVPYWMARAIRVLEQCGVATDTEIADRMAIEARLGMVRATM
jgi:class 3 adenylate cyclase